MGEKKASLRGTAEARYRFGREASIGGRPYRLHLARNPLERLLGLMATDSIAPGHALAFPRCTSVHTCFMRYPIDVVWYGDRAADGSRPVLGRERALAPWRFAIAPAGCRGCVEVAAGGSEGATTVSIG